MSPAAPARVAECRCPLCGSGRKTQLLGEICLHFPGGVESLHKPLLWSFPVVGVCLDCGSAQFTVPEKELRLIRENL
jgi:hypothetical protein